MSRIQTVASYLEEGFCILKDDAGEFLMFKEQDKLVPLDEEDGEILFDDAMPYFPLSSQVGYSRPALLR